MCMRNKKNKLKLVLIVISIKSCGKKDNSLITLLEIMQIKNRQFVVRSRGDNQYKVRDDVFNSFPNRKYYKILNMRETKRFRLRRFILKFLRH